MERSPFQILVDNCTAHYEADVVLYIGGVDRPFDDRLIQLLRNHKRRKNIVLILITLGGDPHAAYRMARIIQDLYRTVPKDGQPGAKAEDGGKFSVYVDSRCKSAGTILALGANAIIMSAYGELGPIDVQLRKLDEVGERSSGLTPLNALETLQAEALQLFKSFFSELRFDEELAFTTRIATDVATKISVGLFSAMYSQIDPMRLGEIDRALKIATEYGTRLGKTNLKDKALARLVSSYPAHGFVIDRKEATELFNTVEDPTEDLCRLGEVCRAWWVDDYLGAKVPFIVVLSNDVDAPSDIIKEGTNNEPNNQPDPQGPERVQPEAVPPGPPPAAEPPAPDNAQ